MGRLSMWLGVPVGLLLGWYERLFDLEWLAWLLGGAWEFVWWLLRGICQLLLAALALAGIGGAHLPSVAFGDRAPFVSSGFDHAFLGVLLKHGGEFGPEIWTYEGRDYWIAVRETADSSTFVDAGDNPTEQVCRHLYAARAAVKDGQYLKPSPHTIFGGMAWPNVVTLCRVDGGVTTYQFPTLHERGTVRGEGRAASGPPDDINALDRTIYGAR